MRNFKLTLIGLVVAIFIFVIALVFDLDIFEHLTVLLKKLEDYEN